MALISKAPDEDLDWLEDWSAWLGEDDTIIQVSWTNNTPGTLNMHSQAYTATTATTWFSGGDAGVFYHVDSEVRTDKGRVGQRTVIVLCEEK